MTFISHAHATLANQSLALSARPDAPVVEEPVQRPRRLPSLVRLTLAWERRAAAHERTWEYRWRGTAEPTCA